MGRKLGTFLGVVLAVALSTHAGAQSPSAFMNMFATMMRAAIIDHARAEWSKIPTDELSCVEQALQQRGYSIDGLIQNGIVPGDPRISGIRSGCRISAVSLPNASGNLDNIGDISATPTFDCTKARSATGRILCVDKEGAKADWDLTSAYWARYFTLDETARDGFSQAEEKWFPTLNRACRLRASQDTFSAAQRNCVYTAYERRAALFRSQLSGDALAESELTPEQHAQIQAELIRRGFLNDTADGEFGENTRNAIKAFQTQSGLPATGFLTAQELQQLLPSGARPSQSHCEVTDPTGTPLNIRNSPDGDVIGTVDNGLSVQIVQTLQDNRGRYWSSIERPSNHQTLGWVFRDYIACTAQNDNTQTPPPPPPPPQPPKDTPQLKQARAFLEDAQKFIAEQQSVPGISAIANEAANLKIALSKYDEAGAVQSMAHLSELLKSISGFEEFEKQQQADRQRESARELAEAESLADKNIYFIDKFLAANLGDPKTADLLGLRQQLDGSRKRAAIEEITKANASLQSYVSDNGLSYTYTHIIAEYTAPVVPRAGPPATLDDRLGLTDKSQFVTHGPADEIDLLYNASPSAPSVWVNVRGDIVFQGDTATLCFAQAAPEAAMLRYVERILGEQGAKRVVLGTTPCDLSNVGTSTDIVAFQRGELLKRHEEYLRALVTLIEQNSFRKYKVITDYSSLAKKNEILSLQIETDVERGARDGFGVIAVSESPAVCVVSPVKADQVDGLQDLLNRNRDLIAPSLNSDWQFVQTTADLAFLGLQRRQCGYVAADAAALQTMMQALRRQQMQYRFAPVWFGNKDIEQATFEARDQIRQQAEKDRLLRQQQELEKKQLEQKKNQKGEIERALREKNGARARGLMNGIADFVRGLADKRLSDVNDFFPNYSNWLNERFAQQWETFSVISDIADFGTVQWKGRSLDAIVVKVITQQKNRVLGQYENTCYMFGLVDDPEFQMQRDRFSVDCDNANSVLRKWEIGEQFQSRWNVE